MIERLLEIWLNSANERSFQIPFAHWLAFTGHQVVHVSRHCAMEFGKDVITIAPDGVPCAYQLKGVDGGSLTLGAWRADLAMQLHSLVHCAIVHPSIRSTIHHRSYIVLNGTLAEEVSHEIAAFNLASERAGQPDRVVETITKGQLFNAFRELQMEFWATNLSDVKTYLEVFLEDGQGPLPKAKLARLLESGLSFDAEEEPAFQKIRRELAGNAIVCSSAIVHFTNAGNHQAEFEAWTLYWAYSAGIASRWRIPLAKISFALDLASTAMYSALARLCEEVEGRSNLVQGDPLADRFVYRARVTHVAGLLGLFGLWSIDMLLRDTPDVPVTLLNVAERHAANVSALQFWGEAALPQILSWNFYRKMFDATLATDVLYEGLLLALITRNAPDSTNPLMNPYYDAEMVLPVELGLEDAPRDDSFTGLSFYAEGLLHLLVRANLKSSVRGLFPGITRIAFREHVPGEEWRFFRYRNVDCGHDAERYLSPPHRWTALRTAADESEGASLPDAMKQFPLHYLAILIVLPHRVSASGLRWLATYIDEMARRKEWMSKVP